MQSIVFMVPYSTVSFPLPLPVYYKPAWTHITGATKQLMKLPTRLTREKYQQNGFVWPNPQLLIFTPLAETFKIALAIELAKSLKTSASAHTLAVVLRLCCCYDKSWIGSSPLVLLLHEGLPRSKCCMLNCWWICRGHWSKAPPKVCVAHDQGSFRFGAICCE